MATLETVRRLLGWTPRAAARVATWGLVFVLEVGAFALHHYSGSFLDFHILFIIPCLIAAWFLGREAGILMAILSSGGWLFSDFMLKSWLPGFALLANTGSRLIVYVLLVWMIGRIRQLMEALTELSLIDALTGLGNRRACLERGQQEISRADRVGSTISLMFFDLDNFKAVNDIHGHDAGDWVLRAVGDALRQVLRKTDFAARLGGDEFAVILPDTDGEKAKSVADKIRLPLCAQFAEKGYQVTLSIGIATAVHPSAPFAKMVRVADGLMYEAKQRGKNTMVWQEMPADSTRSGA